MFAANIWEGGRPTPLQGQVFRRGLSGAERVADALGRTSNIAETTLLGSNGALHTIDTVLVPRQ